MCGSTRANFLLRAISPDLTEEFATRHDSAVWRCLCTILGTPSAAEDAKVLASLSFSCGGLGLVSALRVRRAANFASWADSRHLHIAATMVRIFEAGTTRTFEVVRECKDSVVEAGLEVPSWYDLSFPRAVELV